MKNSYQPLLQFLNTLIDKKTERGIQIAAYLKGELVLDLAVGIADLRSGSSVRSETLFPVFSVSKGLTATIIHHIVHKKNLDYDARIAEAWPDFAGGGKGNITLRQILNHTAGLHLMPHVPSVDDLCHWEKMIWAMESLTPAWAPGTRMEYQPLTWGWILGEWAHRVDGRTFPELFHDIITKPLGLRHFFLGTPKNRDFEIAYLEQPAQSITTENLTTPQTMPVWLAPTHELFNQTQVQEACIPAANGVANARSIAKFYASLLPGGVEGIEMLDPERIMQATQSSGKSHLPQKNMEEKFALGYHIGQGLSIHGGERSFGHGGQGGSVGFADPARSLAVGFTKNFFGPENPRAAIVDKIREVLDLT